MVRSQQLITADLTISRLARAVGVGVETIRFYQREGLLDEPPQGQGRIRHYGADHVERLQFIRRAKLAGFSVREIAELVTLDKSRERQRVRALAAAKLDALGRQIEDLRQAHEALRHLVHMCESEDAGASCPIIECLSGGKPA